MGKYNKYQYCPKCKHKVAPAGHSRPIVCPICDWNNAEKEYQYELVYREQRKHVKEIAYQKPVGYTDD